MRRTRWTWVPFYPAWEVLCGRYRWELFDPQPGLFADHGVESRARWRVPLPRTLSSPPAPRRLCSERPLRTVGLVPCKSKQKASSALCRYLEEMGLPFSAPSWDWSIRSVFFRPAGPKNPQSSVRIARCTRNMMTEKEFDDFQFADWVYNVRERIHNCRRRSSWLRLLSSP